MSELFLNPHVAAEGARGCFSEDDYAAVERFFAARPAFRPTPLVPLPALARRLGLAALAVKDESQRLGLQAFKATGAAYAIERLAAAGRLTSGVALACASAGNHGRAVAHVGAARGFEVTVYMAADASLAARRAIEAEGARVVRVDGSYDDAVRQMEADARRSGAIVVSDTAWPGGEETPRDIMAGYTHILEEARAQWDAPPDATVVQAGVGSLAAAAAAWWSDRYGAARPFFACCEPRSADPLLQSARAGQAVTSAKRIDTIMAGLGCAEPSSVAVPILLRAAHAFVAVEDDLARVAMRLLARPASGDAGIVAGPSGAASLAGLLALRERAHLAGARVLLINTEGATDAELYRQVLAEGDVLPWSSSGPPSVA